MKVLTFDPARAYLIVNKVLLSVRYQADTYDKNMHYSRIDRSRVAIRADSRRFYPHEVNPNLLNLLKQLGVEDTYNLPYKTILGIADVESVKETGSLWTFKDVTKIINPISNRKETLKEHYWLEDDKLAEVLASLEGATQQITEEKPITVSDLTIVTLLGETIAEILSGSQNAEITHRLMTEYIQNTGWVVLYENPMRKDTSRINAGNFSRVYGGAILVGAAKVSECLKLPNRDIWQWHIGKVITFREPKRIYSWIYRAKWDISYLKSESEREDVTKYLLAEMAEIGLTE